ncbi:hypothetical protein AYJ54_02940 [Bradyrhizobium centrolobii]|uniref:Uncharacterized protein n=1 Tax=Bradyrhizobium centrolobii TaxID=1505087 RepID=A0A176YEW3_9BRAD|nr:hypothetical protein AYJ54_02940 [Bradyrhizobium centrolobii]
MIHKTKDMQTAHAGSAHVETSLRQTAAQLTGRSTAKCEWEQAVSERDNLLLRLGEVETSGEGRTMIQCRRWF